MADKRIDELEAAAIVTTTDLFVLQQAGTAKKLTAQILELWLLQLAQGHGGIANVSKTGSSGTNPVVDTYTITFADTTTTTFDVTNGVKGDTGDQTYVYIKYAEQEPTADSDMTDTPSPWIGICSTTAATAPTDYTLYTWYEFKGARVFIKYSDREPISDSDMTDTPSAWMGVCSSVSETAPTSYAEYSWYEIKGAKGDPGNNITITSTSVMYQAWTSGTQYPTGTWVDNPPTVTPGNYLWTRTIVNYSDGGQTVSYSVARWGMDGSGAVASVNEQLPDQNGNVTLTAPDVGALPDSYQAPVMSVNEKTGNVVIGNKDVNAPYAKSVSADLSAAGWYRVLSIGGMTAIMSRIIDFVITRSYTNSNNESHSVRFVGNYNSFSFVGESSKSITQLIDKIRYVKGDKGYIDIHYTGSYANTVCIDFSVYTSDDIRGTCLPESLQSVADAPSGETIQTEYSFGKDGIFVGENTTFSRFTINANSNVTVPFGNGQKGIIVLSGAGANKEIVIVNATTSGVITHVAVMSNSNYTYTTSTNSLKITNGTANAAIGMVIYF